MGVKINHFFILVSASEDNLCHFYSVVSDRSVLLLFLILNLSLFYLKQEVKAVKGASSLPIVTGRCFSRASE